MLGDDGVEIIDRRIDAGRVDHQLLRLGIGSGPAYEQPVALALERHDVGPPQLTLAPEQMAGNALGIGFHLDLRTELSPQLQHPEPKAHRRNAEEESTAHPRRQLIEECAATLYGEVGP